MPEAVKRFKPAMLAIVGEAFLSRLAFGVMAFALPLYARSLGMSLTEIAVLMAVNLCVAILLKPFAGRLADRLGYRRGAVLAILGRSLLTLLFALAGTAWQLFALQTARGAAKALRDPSMSSLIVEHGGKRRIASAFAWYKTATSAAGALGKALAGLLLTLTASNFSWVFVAAFLLSVLPLLAVLRWLPAATQEPEPHAPKLSKPVEEPTAGMTASPSAGLWPAMSLGFLISGTANMLRSLFPILAVEYGGLNEAQAGSLFLVATAVTLVAGPLFGWLADTVSRTLVLTVRSGANITASAIFLAFPSFGGFLIGKAVDEAGKAAFNPAWGSLMAEIAGQQPDNRARTMGWLDAADDAGAVAGPILAGLLWSVWGVGVLLGVRIALAIATELYAFLIFRRSKLPASATKGA